MTTTYVFNTLHNLVCKNTTISTPEQRAILLKLNGCVPNKDTDNEINSQYKSILSLIQPCSTINGIEITRPWDRFRTNCPSSNLDELNMRRKAEVLKYTNNTHKMSKKQRYSRAARNLLTKRKSWANQKLGADSNPNTSNLKPIGYFSNNFDNTSTLSWSGLSSCKANRLVSHVPDPNPDNNVYASNEKPEPLEFPTSASDVPGKPKMLKLDPKIPLTMYTPVRRTYMAGSNKWPQFGWYRGARGFPVGKKGMLFP